MGGEATPESDLCSLGAMLYEMVTGTPSLLGDDSVAIMSQHISSPPDQRQWARVHRLAQDLLLMEAHNADAKAYVAFPERGAASPAAGNGDCDPRPDILDQEKAW